MTFSNLTDFTNISPNNSGQRTQPIIYNIPHCTAVSITAKRIGEIFEKPSRNASCNYGLGNDGKIVGVCPEEWRSWCTSSNWVDQRGITFEISSSNKAPYELDKVAFENWKKLSVDIMRRYGKTRLLYFPDAATAKAYKVKDNEMVIMLHRWFASKVCPGEWLVQRLPEAVAEINARVQEIAPVQAPEGEEYTIKSGDTLSKIGILYGFTADELAAYNGMTNKNKIQAGKTIKIPPRNIQPMTASRAIEILQKVKDGMPGGLTITEINEAFDMAIEKLKS